MFSLVFVFFFFLGGLLLVMNVCDFFQDSPGILLVTSKGFPTVCPKTLIGTRATGLQALWELGRPLVVVDGVLVHIGLMPLALKGLLWGIRWD